MEYLVTGADAGGITPQMVLCQEAREIIRRTAFLSTTQCKAILGLLKAFDR